MFIWCDFVSLLVDKLAKVDDVKSKIKNHMALIAALLLAALLCAGSAAAMAKENTLTIRVGLFEQGTVGLDPTLYDKSFPGKGGVEPYQHHFTHQAPLIALCDNGSIIPWMAESYEVSDDFKTIIFHLRKGIKFADGTPLNASILKFNFDRILTYGWVGKYGYNGTSSARNEFVYYDYSEAPDQYTFKMHFKQGWIDIAHDLGCAYGFLSEFISPLDVEPAWDIKGTLRPEKKYNGLGPYYVDENESVPNEKVVLKKRQCWRDDLNFHRAKPEKIIIVLIPTAEASVLAIEKGDVDFIVPNGMSTVMLPELQKNSKISIMTNPGVQMTYIITAWWKEPFNGTDGIQLRKAICYALNRPDIINGGCDGYATPATDSMFLSSLRADVPECCHKGYDYDLEKAKQLLAEAGWTDSDGNGILDKNGKSLTLELLLTSFAPYVWTKDIALIVQSQLRKVGIEVQIRTLERGGYSDAVKKGDYDLRIEWTNGIFISPAEVLSAFDKGDPIRKDDYTNENGTLKTAVEKARTTISIEERDQNICRASDILYEEAGIIPLLYKNPYYVISSKVKGFPFGTPTDTAPPFEECWVEK